MQAPDVPAFTRSTFSTCFIWKCHKAFKKIQNSLNTGMMVMSDVSWWHWVSQAEGGWFTQGTRGMALAERSYPALRAVHLEILAITTPSLCWPSNVWVCCCFPFSQIKPWILTLRVSSCGNQESPSRRAAACWGAGCSDQPHTAHGVCGSQVLQALKEALWHPQKWSSEV